MEIECLIKGIILGFAIAVPVGPIGILCIRKTLQYGKLSGLLSGLGAATADAIYAIIAAFGLSFISNLLMSGQWYFRLIGGAFLLYLGWNTFFTRVIDRSKQTSHTTLLNDFLSTFFLTITNPMTILSFLALFTTFGLATSVQESYINATCLVLGVFVGSALWWLLLSEGVSLFRKKMGEKVMNAINQIAGIIIMVFGIAALLTVFVS